MPGKAATLDSPTAAAGNIHVIYLKNAEAVKLAEILRAIYTGESSSAQPRAAAPLSATPLAQSQTPAPPSASRPGIIQADAANLAARATYLGRWSDFVALAGNDPLLQNLPARHAREK